MGSGRSEHKLQGGETWEPELKGQSRCVDGVCDLVQAPLSPALTGHLEHVYGAESLVADGNAASARVKYIAKLEDEGRPYVLRS